MDRDVQQLLARRPLDYTVTALRDASVLSVVAEMNARSVGSALVVDAGALVGIFTERDALRRVIERGRDPRLTPVGAVMTPAPSTVGPRASTRVALEQMRTIGVCHLPVVDGATLVGVVALRDIMAALADDLTTLASSLEVENRELQAYIHGRAARVSELPPAPAGAAPSADEPAERARSFAARRAGPAENGGVVVGNRG